MTTLYLAISSTNFTKKYNSGDALPYRAIFSQERSTVTLFKTMKEALAQTQEPNVILLKVEIDETKLKSTYQLTKEFAKEKNLTFLFEKYEPNATPSSAAIEPAQPVIEEATSSASSPATVITAATQPAQATTESEASSSSSATPPLNTNAVEPIVATKDPWYIKALKNYYEQKVVEGIIKMKFDDFVKQEPKNIDHPGLKRMLGFYLDFAKVTAQETLLALQYAFLNYEGHQCYTKTLLTEAAKAYSEANNGIGKSSSWLSSTPSYDRHAIAQDFFAKNFQVAIAKYTLNGNTERTTIAFREELNKISETIGTREKNGQAIELPISAINELLNGTNRKLTFTTNGISPPPTPSK